MPRRNLTILFLVSLAALLCYQKVDRSPSAVLMNTFSDVMSEVRENYVESVDDRLLFEAALEGMLDKLDKHSRFIPPNEYTHLRENLDQKFGGIGIHVTVDKQDNRLVISSPLVGTPAFEAGLRAGDKILAIDGRDTQGVALTAAVDWMRGNPGEPVTLSISREHLPDPQDVVIYRAIINVPTVLGDRYHSDGAWDFRLEVDPRLGYIRVLSFGEQTATELRAAIEGLLQQGMKGLVLDLRSNPGGLLRGAVEVCDMFLSQGRIVSTRSRDAAQLESYDAKASGTLPPFPLAILINGSSASASEIVAACLQDHQRAIVVGERTFGKGSVQNIIPLEGGKSALKLTVASYWRPSGQNIDKALATKSLEGAKPTEEELENFEWGVRPNDGYEVPLIGRELDKALAYRHQRDIFYRAGEKPTSPNGNGDDAAPALDPRDPLLDVDPGELYLDPQLRQAVEHLQQQIERRQSSKAA